MCWSSLIENHCSEWFSLRAIVITMDSLIKWIDLKRYFYSGMWHYKHKQASCGIEALISWESLWPLFRPLCGVLISPIIQYHDLTISIILSIWRFWVSISLPMSRAMWRRLPMIPPTCSKLSSISVSRASFVTLKRYKKQAGFIESTDWDEHNILRMIFTLKSTWKCIRNPFYFHNVTKYLVNLFNLLWKQAFIVW